jgi:hypothetical protein
MGAHAKPLKRAKISGRSGTKITRSFRGYLTGACYVSQKRVDHRAR